MDFNDLNVVLFFLILPSAHIFRFKKFQIALKVVNIMTQVLSLHGSDGKSIPLNNGEREEFVLLVMHQSFATTPSATPPPPPPHIHTSRAGERGIAGIIHNVFTIALSLQCRGCAGLSISFQTGCAYSGICPVPFVCFSCAQSENNSQCRGY